MQEQLPTAEVITLPSGGSIAGLPGSHGPGTYLVDWLERTIRHIENVLSESAPTQEAVEPTPENTL